MTLSMIHSPVRHGTSPGRCEAAPCLAALLLLAAALPAHAGEAVKPSAAGAAAQAGAGAEASAPAAPAIPENAAELEALKQGTLVLPPAPGPTGRRLSPMAREIQQVMEEQQRTLADLQARLAQAGDPRAAHAVQREIERTKLQTQLTILRIQATYARREGRIKTAEQLEAAIEQILNPRVPRAPADRPAPPPAERARQN